MHLQIGCCVIFTVGGSGGANHLTTEFVAACRTAHLSRLATEKTLSLPLKVWMVDYVASPSSSSSFLSLLQFNLAHLPERLLQQCQSLPSHIYPILFNLVVIHTAVALLSAVGCELAPVHYSNLLACATRLLSMHKGHVDGSVLLHSLQGLVNHVYSGCVPREKLEGVIRTSLSVDACSASGGIIQPLPGVQVKVPTSNPTEFLDHVLKLGDQDKTTTNRSGGGGGLSGGCLFLYVHLFFLVN